MSSVFIPPSTGAYLPITGGTLSGDLVCSKRLKTSFSVLDDGEGNANIAGTLTAANIEGGTYNPTNITTQTIVCSGTMSAGATTLSSATIGPLSTGVVTTTGSISATGTVSCGSLNSSGTVAGGNANFANSSTSSQFSVSAFAPAAAGNFNGVEVGISGAQYESAQMYHINTAGSASSTNTANFGVAGATALSVDGTGHVTMASATATGALTAASATVSGALTVGGVGVRASNVNVLAYGADPTGAADSTTAIQNAINAAISTGVLSVYCPAGRYLILGTLNISSQMEFCGANSYSTIFLANSNFITVTMANTNTGVVKLHDFLVSDAGTSGSYTAITVNADTTGAVCSTPLIERVTIECGNSQITTGIALTGCANTQIRDCRIGLTNNGSMAGITVKNTVNVDIGDNWITTCAIEGCQWAIKHFNGGGLYIQDNKLESNQYAYFLDGTIGATAGVGTEYLQFIGNNVDGGLIYISADATHPLAGFGQIIIANNVINMSTAAAAAIEVQPNGVSGYWIAQFAVTGNQILSSGSSAQYGVLLRGTNIYTVKDNTFFVHGSGTFQPYYIDSSCGYGVVDDAPCQSVGGAIQPNLVAGPCWYMFPQASATTTTNLNLNYSPTTWSGSSGAASQLNIGSGGTNSLQLLAQDNTGAAAYVSSANTLVVRSETGAVSLQAASGQAVDIQGSLQCGTYSASCGSMTCAALSSTSHTNSGTMSSAGITNTGSYASGTNSLTCGTITCGTANPTALNVTGSNAITTSVGTMTFPATAGTLALASAIPAAYFLLAPATESNTSSQALFYSSYALSGWTITNNSVPIAPEQGDGPAQINLPSSISNGVYLVEGVINSSGTSSITLGSTTGCTVTTLAPNSSSSGTPFLFFVQQTSATANFVVVCNTQSSVGQAVSGYLKCSPA